MHWNLVYETLMPKECDASPNACLNRLTNERLRGLSKVSINLNTANIREELWPTGKLKTLDIKHKRMHDFEGVRPIVVVEIYNKLLLVDGSHRVNRWLSMGLNQEHRVLLISLNSD